MLIQYLQVASHLWAEFINDQAALSSQLRSESFLMQIAGKSHGCMIKSTRAAGHNYCVYDLLSVHYLNTAFRYGLICVQVPNGYDYQHTLRHPVAEIVKMFLCSLTRPSLFVVFKLAGNSPDYIIFEINIRPQITKIAGTNTHQMGHLRAKVNQISMPGEV